MPGLDCDQPAEPAAQDEDRPEPQRAADNEQRDPKPADGVAFDGPEPGPVGVGRQIGVQKPDHREGGNDPAVPPVLAHPGADVTLSEGRRGQHDQERNRDRGQCRLGEERGEPAAAEDRQPEIDRRAGEFGQQQSKRQVRPQPQTSRATSTTRRSLAFSSSIDSALPSTVEEKPHCGLRHSCSSGTYLAASSIRCFNSSLSSSAARLVVTKPSTIFFGPRGTKRSGANPPERSSSYSRKKPSTASSPNKASATWS